MNTHPADDLPALPSQVLVVDDHPFILASLTALLRQMGCTQITTADNGVSARQACLHSPPGLIICDLNMPGEDGLVFLRRQAEAADPTPVILISAEDSTILKAAINIGRGQNLNILGSLEKPVTRSKLASLWHTWQQSQTAPTKRFFSDSGQLSSDDLNHALAGGGLEVWFQPQIRCDSGEVNGFEALARLIHPNKGLIGPDTFIPIAERHGQIVEITDIVLQTSLDHLQAWQKLIPSLSVSVNFSALSLNDLNLPDRLELLCQQRQIKPEQVVIELTESAVAKNQTAMLDILTRLRLKRFQLSIDDYGTGFSSMQQLGQLPFTELKIDKSFVMPLQQDQTARQIVESSVKLATALKLTTVAEGVEDAATLKQLGELGCRFGQGYHIAKPMPAAQVTAWLETCRARAV